MSTIEYKGEVVPLFRSDNLLKKNIGNTDASGRVFRVDDAAMSFFANEFVSYAPKTYDKLVHNLNAYLLFNEVEIPDDGTSIYEYKMFEGYGESTHLAEKSGKAKDAKQVGIAGQKYFSSLADVGCVVAYCNADLAMSQKSQFNLVDKLMQRATRSNMELMNKICFTGHAGLGLPGLLKNNGADVNTLTSTVNLTSTTTAEVLLAKLTEYFTAAENATDGLITPTHLLVAPKIWNYLNLTISNAFSNASVKTIFESLTGVAVKKVTELGAGKYGNAKDLAIFYNDNEDYIQRIVCQRMQALEPEKRGYEYLVYCRSRYGGLVILHPKSITVITNA